MSRLSTKRISARILSRVAGCTSFFILACVGVGAQDTRWSNSRIESKVNALLEMMSLEEKVGQLNFYSADRNDGIISPDMITGGEAGGVVNVAGGQNTNAIQRIAMEKSRLKIPILFGVDVSHGYRTIFPVPLAMSATWNPELVERAARLSAHEASADGIRWTLSPMVDVVRDGPQDHILESAGEEPYLASLLAQAYIRGYQGKVVDRDSLAACAKHYVDLHTSQDAAPLSSGPLHAAVQAGTLTVMGAFDSSHALPPSASTYDFHELRTELGFRGVTVRSDSMENSHAGLVGGEVALRTRQAFSNGADVEMGGNLYHNNLANLVKSGDVSRADLDQAVRNVLHLKYALGLFDRPYAEESLTRADNVLPLSSRELARSLAEHSFVLLKNGVAGESPVLPIKKDIGWGATGWPASGQATQTIALIGPFGDDPARMLGPWTAKGQPRDVVGLRAALTEYAAANNAKVIYAKGTEIGGGNDSAIGEALEAASDADIVLLAVGEDVSSRRGERALRETRSIPENQISLIQKVAAVGKPTVLIVFSGGPVALDSVEPKVSAIVEAWIPGVEAGPALVRMLFGEVTPDGRLTVSFPRLEEPGRSHQNRDHAPAGGSKSTASIKADPGRSDGRESPLYPFGYGLTYSNFSYSVPKLDHATTTAASLESGAVIGVTADVKNTGFRAATEVVQLYVGRRSTTVPLPIRELKNYRRVELAPGESRTVRFTIGREELSFWDTEKELTIEPTQMDVWIAPDSASGTAAELEIK